MPRMPDLRTTLLDQLAYLIDEIEALKGVVTHVPEPILEARPLPTDFSVKETYGLLATLDEMVYLPRFQQTVAEDNPTFETVDQAALVAEASWHDHPLPAILERVQTARKALLTFLHTLPSEAWHHTAQVNGAPRDLYAQAHHITQHDVDLLRTVGYRLHESRPIRKTGAPDKR